MCQTCKKVQAASPQEGLRLIEAEMKKGKDPEHFKAVLDNLLGTQEPIIDRARDAAWERSTRRSRASSADE